MNLKESKDENEDVEPGELLEDCWFFGNLLQTKSKSKSRMVRSFSDPCSSSNFPGKSYEETTPRRNRTTKERRSNGKTSSSKNSLVRAPSLPTSLESENFDDDDEEMEFSMGKLIRQASLNYSDTRPPRKNAAKSVTASSSLTRRRKTEIEELQGIKEKELSPNPNVERRMEEYEAKRGAKPYLSEAPPVPRWGGKRSTEDVKAQIKFWARAVASNVRQEC